MEADEHKPTTAAALGSEQSEDGSTEDEEDDIEGQDESDDDDGEPKSATGPSLADLARGQVLLESSDEEGPAGNDDDTSESDSDSDDGREVTLGGLTGLGRARERSPSIDLSETEHVFGDDDDEDDAEIDSDDEEEGVDPTPRLAIVNMDWDHLRAVDLYRVLASSLSATAPAVAAPKPTKNKKFDDNGQEVVKPSSRLNIAAGRLLHLRIYPSTFGTERMAREEKEGPPTEVFAAARRAEQEEEAAGAEGTGAMVLGRKRKQQDKRRRRKGGDDDSDEESEAEGGEEYTEKDLLREQIDDGAEDYDTEALRKYQLERLRFVFLSPGYYTVFLIALALCSLQILLRNRHIRQCRVGSSRL